MSKTDTETSKFLSFVLRHQPESIGLTLDREGWAEIDVLIAQAKTHGRSLNREQIVRVAETNSKKRFSISENGLRIRAVQGHSTETVALSHVEKEPPAVLYHGTATRFLESIFAEGLKPGSRHHVHLSLDRETAATVGQRHGKPAILEVDTAAMRAKGHAFYLSENGVWLTERVPAAFLTLLDE